MKASASIWLLVFAALARAQGNPPAGPTLTADKVSHDGGLLRGSGHVRVKIAGLLLEADEGVQNPEKQTVELRGHVVVRLPAEPPFWVVRCGPARAIVATDPMIVSADEISITARLLHARGHIQTKKDFTVLQADEADFYLNAGDAELRGNLRVNGTSPEPPASQRRYREGIFPPEIVR